MNPLCEHLSRLGKKLKFDVRTEVQASDSAFVDLVWFDSQLPIPTGKKSFNMRYSPVLPVVGFEIELHTGLNAKHIKGSVSNLSNLGAQLGVIVMGDGNLAGLKKQPAHEKKSDEDIRQMLCDRVYRWVYAEAQPKGRIIVMFEDEVTTWGKRISSNPGDRHRTTWCRVFNISSLRKDSANGNDKSGRGYHATWVPRTQFSGSGKCRAGQKWICRLGAQGRECAG